MAYSDDDIRDLYRKIAIIVKKKSQVSLEELSKELNTEIDLKQEPRNVLGGLLLACAIEGSNLDFVKFLFKDKLRIISIVSHEEESYHIINARNNRSILNHAIHFGNTEILDLLLQSINTEQQELESESKLYKLRKKLKDNGIYDFYHKIDQITRYDHKANNLQHLQEQGRIEKGIKLQDKCKEGDALVGEIFLDYATEDQNQRVKDFLSKNGCSTIFPQQKQMGCTQSKLYELCQILKDNALFTAVGKGNSEAVELLIASGANPEAQEVGGEKRTVLDMAIKEDNEKIVMLLISAISKKQEKQKASHIETNSASSNSDRNVGRPIATVPPTSNKETNANPTTTSSSNNKTNGFTNAQFSLPNTPETKESRKNFYTSLTTDVVGVVITGLFIAAAVMVPSVAGAVVCGIVAALVTIATGLHVKDSTLPSYRAMEENKVEHLGLKAAEI